MELLVPIENSQAIFLIKNVHQDRQGKLFSNIFPQITVTKCNISDKKQLSTDVKCHILHF